MEGVFVAVYLFLSETWLPFAETLLTKVRLVKAMVFPVVMYGCESWTMKKAECQKLMLFFPIYFY